MYIKTNAKHNSMKFNKIVSLASFAFIMFFSTSLFAEPIVVLSETASDYTQTETGYVVNFKLDATSAELAEIESKVASMPDRISMSVTLISEGHYDIVYTVTHQNQPEYVHKMMLVSGFSKVNYQGSDFGLIKVVDVLKSYQN